MATTIRTIRQDGLRCRWLAAVASALSVGLAAAAQTAGGDPTSDLRRQYPALDDPRYGLLSPIPEHGNVPPIVDLMRGSTPNDWDRMAEIHGYRDQIHRIRRQHFANRSASMRQRGLDELRTFSDPAAFIPMVQILRNEDDAVRLAVLDHLAASGEGGHAALAWTAIHDPDQVMRAEATRRLTSPPSSPVLWMLDKGLRDRDHDVASQAAVLAGSLNAVETIPLLIAGQVSSVTTDDTGGDLAWIAVQKQTVYVQSLQTVVGNSAAAFLPVPAVLSEGFVLRVQDAVVIIYRAAVNHALVAMSSYDWGQSTAHLGYDQAAWWDWYNRTYVPYKNEQARLDALSAEPGVN